MKTKKKVIAIIGMTICIALVVVVCISLIRTLHHTRQLRQFAQQLFEITLPADTKIVEQYTTCGNAYGKENKMGFTAVLLLETSQSDEFIKGYYFKQNYKCINKESEIRPSVEIIRPESPYIQSRYLNQGSIYLESLEEEDEYENLVTVMITDYN